MIYQRMYFAAAVLLCAVTLIPCAWSGEKPPPDPEALKAYQTGIYAQYVTPGKPTIVSQQLVDVMWEITELQYKETPAEEKKLPPGMTEEELLKKLKERVAGFPCVQVTAEDDEKFKDGKFDEINNFIALMDFLKILKDNKIPVPPTIQVLQRNQRQGGLKGARLELAVRFTFMSIAKLYRSAEKK